MVTGEQRSGGGGGKDSRRARGGPVRRPQPPPAPASSRVDANRLVAKVGPHPIQVCAGSVGGALEVTGRTRFRAGGTSGTIGWLGQMGWLEERRTLGRPTKGGRVDRDV